MLDGILDITPELAAFPSWTQMESWKVQGFEDWRGQSMKCWQLERSSWSPLSCHRKRTRSCRSCRGHSSTTTSMTLVYCGSFASVHSHKPASPSRVSALRPTSLHRPFSGSSLQAPSCVRVANPLDYPCTNGGDLVGLDQSNRKQPHWTTTGIRSLVRMRAPLLRPGAYCTQKHTTTEPGVCNCGSRICGGLSAFRSRWLESVTEGSAFRLSLAVGFVIGVCMCENLCCATPTWVSRFGLKFQWRIRLVTCCRSDAVSSLGSTRWSSRISCMSGVWYPAGMNKTKPLREDTRSQLLGDSTHSGGRCRKSCSALRSSRWTIEGRTFLRFLWDGAYWNCCRIREPGSGLCCLNGIHRIVARWAAATYCSIDLGCCMARRMRQYRGDVYHTRLHGRIHWQARCHRSQGSGAHSHGVQLESHDIGDACRVSKVERSSATRGLHSAWERCGDESHPFFRQTNVRSPMKNRCASSPALPTHLQSGRQSWTSPEAHGHWRRSLEWIRANGDGIHRGSHRRQPCPGVAHSTHPSRVPWNCHCAREESAEGPDGSCQGVLPTAAILAQDPSAKSRTRTSTTTTSTTTCRTSRRSETCQSSRTTGSGRQGREDQGRRGILRLGRELHAGPGQLRCRNACVSSNPPVPSVIQTGNLPMLKMVLLPLWKTIWRLQMCGNSLVRAWKTIGRTRRQTRLLIGPTLHAALLRSHLLFSEMVQRSA